MSYSDIDRPIYYPDDYDYSPYYQNEFHDYPIPSDPRDTQAKKPVVLPTVNYLNERKCPIYIHHLRNDSSVNNNYSQKLTIPRKNLPAPQNASKFVLDKLEETYWATWKPKKENLPVKKKSPRKDTDLGLPDTKTLFRVHNKGSKKTSNEPHGDVNENIIKYFRRNDFISSSTAASVAQEETNRVENTRTSSTATSVVQDQRGKKSGSSTTVVSFVNETTNARKSFRRPLKIVTQKDSVSQEIQTEVHCPVILEQANEDSGDNMNLQVIFEKEEEAPKENVESVEDASKGGNEKQSKTENQPEKKNKPEEKGKPKQKIKKHSKNNRKSKKDNKKDLQEMSNFSEAEGNSDSITTFLQLKDSVEITKKKREKEEPQEHFQQPKCIRLYRKSGGTSGYIKGGTYPLKSCLKKDGFPKGNFRLGAPGSPLFITTSSFSNKKKK